jgi:hypothetical protein
MAVNVDGLVHVELTIVPPSKGVENMMRVLSAKSRENDAALISASIMRAWSTPPAFFSACQTSVLQAEPFPLSLTRYEI